MKIVLLSLAWSAVAFQPLAPKPVTTKLHVEVLDVATTILAGGACVASVQGMLLTSEKVSELKLQMKDELAELKEVMKAAPAPAPAATYATSAPSAGYTPAPLRPKPQLAANGDFFNPFAPLPPLELPDGRKLDINGVKPFLQTALLPAAST